MNGITELAKLLKARENKTEYFPMFGRIIELPGLKIRLSDKVILTAEHIKSCVSLDTLSSDGEYIYLGVAGGKAAGNLKRHSNFKGKQYCHYGV